MKYTLFIFFLFFLTIANISFGEKLSEESISIGKYTAGCIKNPRVLPVDGFGYQVIRISKNRNYGHKHLIKFIDKFTAKVKSNYSTMLLIADMAKRNGGPMLEDHNSHQTGLDTDILYIHKGKRNIHRYSISEREKISSRSVLNRSKMTIDPNKWDLVNGEILKLASSDDSVDRIFVNPLIKKKLCLRYGSETWLRKIRPWWGHDGHFHVRLKCPENSIKCVPSPKLPEGTGCEISLNWWFSKKAHEEKIKKITNSKKRQKPVPPEECKEIL